MNTSRLKSFAPEVRRQLMEAVGRRLDYVLTADTPDLRQAAGQVSTLRREAGKDRSGLIERVSYTWFNRLAALRFLDARGWHPFKARVLTPATPEETQPEILKLLRTGSLPDELRPHTDLARLNDLLDGRLPTAIAGAAPQGEAYRGLILAACRFYHATMPFLFEELDDETELLLPDDLLTANSVAEGFRTEISDEDCSEVEILGWLYQFYISEKKDTVMARKSAVPSEDIPAVTQLFTPHWIVRYLVENSLGRLWLNSRPHSRLREHMPYYVEVESGECGVESVGHETTKLQRPDRLAESHGLGGADPSTQQNLSEGGNLRTDQPAPEGGGFGAVEHRRGASPQLQGGVSPLSVHQPRLPGGGGNPTPAGSPLQVSGGKDGPTGLGTSGGGETPSPRAGEQLEVGDESGKWKVGSGKSEGTRGKLEVESGKMREEATLAPHSPLSTSHSAVPTLPSHAPASHSPLPTSHSSPLRIERPEDIRLIDPACGSGHMLTYAFDLLVKIYEEEGHAPSEIPEKILTHNLFGLEICPRAAQLAGFALVCKAREQSRRAFRSPIQPQVLCLRDVVLTPDEIKGFTDTTGTRFSQDELAQIHQFRENTGTFGALIQPVLDTQKLVTLKIKIGEQAPAGDLLVQNTHRKLRLVLEQAEMLSQRYQVVVANPPYMGGGQMNPFLKRFVGELYPKAAGDCAACFALRNIELALSGGRIGMITFQTWMFVSSFSEFREHLLSVGTVSSFVHNGRGVWGPDFGSCAFCFIARPTADNPGVFIRLFEKNSMVQSNEQLIAKFLNRDASRTFVRNSSSFRRVPGVPMAYWISDALADTFAKNPAISSYGAAKTGLSSGDKAAFCREWSEVSHCRIKFDARDHRAFTDEDENPGTWAPLVTGGPFRKWYGNLEEVILWSDAGKKVRDFVGSTIRNPNYYFKSGITWSDVTISTISFRLVPDGLIICDVGPMAFFDEEALVLKALAWGNTIYTERISKALNPTVHFKTGDFHRIPAKFPDGFDRALPEECVKIARADWDNFETSWDFRDLPFLRSGLKGATLEGSWRNWETHCTTAIRRMQELETENNRLFIAAYGLEGELQPEVPEHEITLARADQRKDVAAFLSYAVGCMMGRYSLDAPGLILANAGDTLEDYARIIAAKTVESEKWRVESKEGVPQLSTSHSPLPTEFPPDEDGIIPILDGDWFTDDVVARTREFLRVTFGETTLKENLRFIEQSLGKSLEKYFLTDFYKDHLQTYKKRPIYWLFQSPKKGFSALVYLHRYTKDTVNTLLNKYLRDYLKKLDSRISHLTHVEATAGTTKEKTAARKEREQLQKALKDCQEWERETILPLAQQRLEIDLDDGVKVNYLKFGDALAPIPGLAAKED